MWNISKGTGFPARSLPQTGHSCSKAALRRSRLRKCTTKDGFTLLEVILTTVLFAILAVASTYLFNAILLSWSGQEARSGMGINLDRGIEEMVRELREARQVQSTAGYDEIRYRQGTSNHYIFYLYHANDSYAPPPAFNQSSYQLKKATLSGGINGVFTYGAGEVRVNEVVPPTTSDLSLSGNLLTLDLTVKRGDESIRTRTRVRPRNCGFTGEPAC